MIRREGFVTGFSMALGAAVLALFLLIGWRFLGAVTEILTPFVVGTALALLLNPVVSKVQTRFMKGNRGRAVLFVFLTFLLVFIGLIAYLVPTVINQTSNLIRFFAPLTYRVEQRVPGSAPKIIASDLASNSYTVGNLKNGQNYTFRVVALDADGREYRLRPVRTTPSARQVVVADGDSSGPNANEVATSPTPRPVATATPLAVPTTAPTASPSPSAGTRPSPRPTVSARDVALLPRSTVSPTVTPTPTASASPGATPTPAVEDFPSPEFGDTDTTVDEESPSPEPSAFPFLVPGATGDDTERAGENGASAEPTSAPTTEPEATPSPEPEATPSPQPTAVPTVAPTATPTPRGNTAGTGQNEKSSRTISLLETTTSISVKPGTIVATPGNSKVRLNWRPPTNVQSGFERLRAKADSWLAGHRKIGFVTLPGSIAGLQSQYADQASAWVQDFAKRIASTIIGSLGILITIVLIPLVTFYVLSDMERLRGRLLFFLPEKARMEFVRVVSDVGDVFGNYIRGMATVSAIYGVVNFAVFLGLGLAFQHGLASYAILLGFVAGILYPVPYVGPTSTTLLAGIIAAATGHEVWQTVTIVALALVINQVFDNLIVPRLVGKSVGLHPMITLFSLLIGGNLFGLWGMLLSVPVAASVQLILFRLFPRLGAPTPIAYLMPDRKPQPDADGGSTGKPSYRDLLRTPDAVTTDKPSQALQDKAPDIKTDTTGNPPLGPVPTFRPPTADAPEKPSETSAVPSNSPSDPTADAKIPPTPEPERPKP